MQSEDVNDGWAAQNLHVIRTLMERAALYRRALAPVSSAVGALGLLAGALGWASDIASVPGFVGLWTCVAVLSLGAAFVIMRRQALRDAEPFWSPPTRRVVEAMTPALFAGLVAGVIVAFSAGEEPRRAWWLTAAWMSLFGVAAHAAGFFMPRGIKLLGWIFLVAGAALAAFLAANLFGPGQPSLRPAHLLMGATFGGLHLAYGGYLALTENRNPGP